jgi:uncharacterized membrane protein YgcG
MTSLIAMICMEPIFWCWNHPGPDFDGKCEEEEGIMFPYTVFSMIAMFMYYLLMLDLAVISTRISAYFLVCVRMLSEVALFLGALGGMILTFSCMVSVLKQDLADFTGIHNGAYSLFRMVLGIYDASDYKTIETEITVLLVVFIFGIASFIFLLNMLIAQLSCAYSAIYEDMVGYARMERADTIVDIMPQIPKKRWVRFVDSLKLHRRLEFNEGDIGVAGGIQMKEPASANPTTVDMIRRFGGSTSPEVQWPADDQDEEGEDKFERMEKLIQRTLQRLTKKGGGKRGGGGTSTGMSGTGTNQSGTGSNQESNSGGSSVGGDD